MQRNEIEELCTLLLQKSELLENYDDISVRLLTDDVDKLEHLLDVRNEFLLEFNKITPRIDAIVSRQSSDEQTILQAMLCYEAIEGSKDESFCEINRILHKMKALIDAINEKTKKTDKRFDEYRQGLMDELLKLNKSQQIIHYVGSASNSDILRGRRIDEKS